MRGIVIESITEDDGGLHGLAIGGNNALRLYGSNGYHDPATASATAAGEK